MECKKEQLALAFVGRSNSGKTTLVEQIIALLSSRNLAIGSVKHHGHHGIEIDKEGKDSWRHMRAGSIHTVISSPDKLISIEIRKHEQKLEHILQNMESVDIVIVEGYRSAGIPYFELHRKDNPRDLDEFSIEYDAKRIALVTDKKPLKEVAHLQGIAYFDLNDVHSISNKIEELYYEKKRGSINHEKTIS